MSWQNEITKIVRAIINDFNEPQTYCASRLEELIVIAAQLTKNDIELDTIYTINIGTSTISPDPTSAPRDDNFINLIALKASCLIINGEAKLATAGNIRVTDAGASVDLSGQYLATKQLADKICKDYTDARAAYRMGNLSGIKAILTPYTSSYVDGGIYFG